MATCKSLPLNYEELFELNITPSAGVGNETWSRIAAGIMSIDISNNEDVAQDKYLDDEGFGTSTVIGAQYTMTFSGHSIPADAVQNYVSTLEFQLGDARCTDFKRTDSAGNSTSGVVTIANIDMGGGDAGAKEDISFEIHFNGKPVRIGKQGAAALTITVAAGTVTGSTSFTATPTASNTLAYALKGADAGAVYAGEYISGETDYTSGTDIADVVVDQWLWAYELDENKRVVKFITHKIVAVDIAT